MSEQEFSPLESLQLIREMISKTKQGLYDRSRYFLLWGWGTFIACFAQFILKVIFDYPYHYRVWLLVIVYFIINRIMIYREKKSETTVSYVKEAMGYLWMGIGISFFVISMIFSKMGWQYCYPFFMLLYGLGTFVSGKMLKFKPLVIGGIISWILAAVSVYFDYDYQMLFACASLLVSYIIPGHILRSEYRRSKKEKLITQTI